MQLSVLLCHRAGLFFMLGCVFAAGVLNADQSASASPAVLMIDDFERGLDHWNAQGCGHLAISEDDAGNHALVWTADTDGIGHIVYQGLDRSRIDFSQYDQLVFRIKIQGKPIWNINPIIQQAPHGYGFRLLYYSIDTMDPYDVWYTFSQDLSRWENAWPDTYDASKQEFQFEIFQLAGSGATRIELDDIRLVKNPLALKPSYPGNWSVLEDGSQVMDYQVALTNHGDKPVTVHATPGQAGSIKLFTVKMPDKPLLLAAGQTGDLHVRITANPDVIRSQRPGYGETAQLALTLDTMPDMVLYTDLVAGIGVTQSVHPALLCDPGRMEELQKQWADPLTRKKMDRYFHSAVKQADKALADSPTYPPNAAIGIKKDPVSGGVLKQVNVPNLSFNVYQDPVSGRSYSGPLYDAGVLNWQKQHMDNAQNARELGIGYLITGRRDYAQAAADILNHYADSYLTMPIVAPSQAGPVGSATSGAVRIGSTFMAERVWLENLAIALDSIRPDGVLSDQQVQRIASQVFEPSANLMMDHHVGVMNLQWMIQASSLYAGIAADLPALTARALHDSHGIVRLVEMGFLNDGQWWENPSYQGVAKLVAYPTLGVALLNHMIPWDDRYQNILRSAYALNGPDGRNPTLGTGGWRDLKIENTGVHIFSRYITDPALAWILYHNPPTRTPYNMEDFAQFRRTAPRVPENMAIDPRPNHTVNLPDYGGLAMRLPGTDRYCYFHYGRELVHGHRNKLSINAYGNGGWFARNVMGGYGDNFTDFLETIASSTSIMVDGQNADTDTGELLFQDSVPGAEVASAREIGAWKDVEHERTLVLTGGPLIVIDRCKADAQHTYDWLYHANMTGLSLRQPTLPDAPKDALGSSKHLAGLQLLGQIPAVHQSTWMRKDDSGVQINLLPVGDVYAFQTKDAIRGDAGLLWRQQGATKGFACAYLPFVPGEKPVLHIEAIVLTDEQGRPVRLEDAQGYEVTWPQGSVQVIVRYTDIKLSGIKGPVGKRVWVMFKS